MYTYPLYRASHVLVDWVLWTWISSVPLSTQPTSKRTWDTLYRHDVFLDQSHAGAILRFGTVLFGTIYAALLSLELIAVIEEEPGWQFNSFEMLWQISGQFFSPILITMCLF